MVAEISERNRRDNGFMSLLSFAVCEWFLIFLLYVDGALSYLLSKFAQYCELETPYLFCSMLDNGVGGKKPGFYWSLLCCNHREEISSLVCCFVHGKFADVGSMCGECLKPNVIAKQSNPESWVDVDRSVFQNLILDKHIRCSTEVRQKCENSKQRMHQDVAAASDSWGLSVNFISVILLPIVGNAVEHAGAIIFAFRNKLDISLGVALGSATQIAMFVVPLSVIISWFIGVKMDLNLSLLETSTLALSILVTAFALQDGTSHYVKGLVLLFCYFVIGACFFLFRAPLNSINPRFKSS